jgi:hypothetical protein
MSSAEHAADAAGSSGLAAQNEGSAATAEGPNEIRTLFVSGFPRDVRYREVLNLFRFHEGFSFADLSFKATGSVSSEC